MSSYYFVGQSISSGSGGFNPGGSNSQTGPFYDVNSGGTPTALGAGYIIGPATTAGISLVYAASGVFQLMNGNQTANASIRANSFQTVLNDGSVEFGNQAGTYGLATSGTSASLVGGGTIGLTVSTQGQITAFRYSGVNKSISSYTVLATDTGTFFNNAAASGSTAFVLPTATLGLYYVFEQVQTLAGIQMTITPNGTDQFSYAGKAAGASFVSAAAVQGTLSVHCYATGKWAIVSLAGTWS